MNESLDGKYKPIINAMSSDQGIPRLQNWINK